MLSDLTFAFRSLRQVPGFTAVTLLTLALGIGSSTTIFNILNVTFLRPLPYAASDRLVHVEETKANAVTLPVAYPNFRDWEDQQDTFAALAIYHVDGRTLRTSEIIEQVPVALVSAEFFSVLSGRVSVGRELSPGDDRPGAEPVAWVTHGAWQRFFSGAPDLIGRVITIAGEGVAVAGILPADFQFHRPADIFLPIGAYADRMFMNHRQNRHDTQVIGRLKPGVTLAAARAQFEAIGRRLEQEHPESNTGIRPRLDPLRERLAGGARSQLLLLFGAVAMLLLITSVNIANMLLARAVTRERELAVRTALGASRWQLVRQLLVESAVLAAIGGLFGGLLGWWGYDFVRQLVPWQIRALAPDSPGFDWRVLFFP
jgi:putative ABC transport system permease protein